MPEADPEKIITFETPKDLGDWLKVNHNIENELWVKVFKIKSSFRSTDAVIIQKSSSKFFLGFSVVFTFQGI